MARPARARRCFSFSTFTCSSRSFVLLVVSLTFISIFYGGLSLSLSRDMTFPSLAAKGRLLALGAFLGLSLPGASPASAAGSSSTSMLLYSASYNGYITTLNLTLIGTSCGGAMGGDGVCNATLEALDFADGCWPDPSWIELDHANSVLYCSDEGLSTPKGSLSSFRTTASGTLEPLDKVDTIKGPVSSIIFGDGGKALALAQ